MSRQYRCSGNFDLFDRFKLNLQYQLKVVDVIETDEEKASGTKMEDDGEEAHPIEVVKFWKAENTGALGELFVAGSLNGLVYVYEPTGRLRLKPGIGNFE